LLAGRKRAAASYLFCCCGRRVGHEDSVEAAGFSKQLPLGATAGIDGKLIIWDCGTFTQRGVCQHDQVRVCGPCTCWLTVGCSRAALAPNADLPWCVPLLLPPHPAAPARVQPVTRMAWAAAAPLVATGSLDGVVRLWDLRTADCVKQLHGHSSAVQDLVLSPDGSMLLSGADDATARVFSLAP
jgi:ribosome assembly protein SQT1